MAIIVVIIPFMANYYGDKMWDYGMDSGAAYDAEKDFRRHHDMSNEVPINSNPELKGDRIFVTADLGVLIPV